MKSKKNNYKISSRIMDIIPLAEKGMNNEEIGEILYISNKTVEYHKTKFKNDVGGRNFQQSIYIARNNKMI